MNKEQNVDSKLDFSVLTPFYWEGGREGVFEAQHKWLCVRVLVGSGQGKTTKWASCYAAVR